MTRITTATPIMMLHKEVYILNKCRRHHRYLKYGVMVVCVPFMTAAKSYLHLPSQSPLIRNTTGGHPRTMTASDLARYVSTKYGDTSAWDDDPVVREAPPFPAWQYDAPSVTPQHGPYVKMIPSMDDLSESEGDFPSLTATTTTTTPEERDPRSRPVVYRFFGRSNQRSQPKVPLILLGPCADHWKETGKLLAARGYSVMACEEVNDDDNESDGDAATEERHRRGGDDLVSAVLDALRWQRAVVVGCGPNARSAMEAAMRLGPDRVAGLVLCGDLSEAEELLTTDWEASDQFCYRDRRGHHDSLDQLLREHVRCPSTIVWNGDLRSLAGSQQRGGTVRPVSPDSRTSVVGGGSAPHRRLPDQFAWVLSRFVEEHVAAEDRSCRPSTTDHQRHNYDATTSSLRRLLSPGSLLVTGRVVASSIIYACALSVTLYQYRNLRCGLSEFRTNCGRLSVWRRQGLNFVKTVLADDTGRKYGMVRKMGSKVLLLRGVLGKKGRGEDPPSDEEETVVPRDEDEGDDTRPFPSEVFRLFGLDSVLS